MFGEKFQQAYKKGFLDVNFILLSAERDKKKQQLVERVLGRYAVMVWADGMHSYVMHQEVLCIITILMIATLL